MIRIFILLRFGYSLCVDFGAWTDMNHKIKPAVDVDTVADDKPEDPSTADL